MKMKVNLPGKLGRYARLLSFAGAALSIFAAILSSLAGLFAVRLFRCLDTVQRVLPTLEAAAKVYLNEHQPPQPPIPEKPTKKPMSHL